MQRQSLSKKNFPGSKVVRHAVLRRNLYTLRRGSTSSLMRATSGIILGIKIGSLPVKANECWMAFWDWMAVPTKERLFFVIGNMGNRNCRTKVVAMSYFRNGLKIQAKAAKWIISRTNLKRVRKRAKSLIRKKERLNIKNGKLIKVLWLVLKTLTPNRLRILTWSVDNGDGWVSHAVRTTQKWRAEEHVIQKVEPIASCWIKN